MEPIKNVVLKVVEALERSTKERQVSTEALAKLVDFQTCGDPQLEKMKLEAARFISHNDPCWLSFLGNSGTGKTFLAKLMGCEIYPWYEIIGWARDGDKQGREDFHNLALGRRYSKYEGRYFPTHAFLCIDDIGAEYVTDYSRSKLCEFLNRREEKRTVITANMSLEQISKDLDPRIASRMLRHGSVVVEVDTTDFSLR